MPLKVLVHLYISTTYMINKFYIDLASMKLHYNYKSHQVPIPLHIMATVYISTN